MMKKSQLVVLLLSIGFAVNAKIPVQPVMGLLEGRQQPKFVNDLPNPLDKSFIFKAEETKCFSFYELAVSQFTANLGIVDPNNNNLPLTTTMWGYGTPKQPATYPSRTIIAETGRQVRVNWLNELKNAQGNLPHLLPVDTSIHWADPQNPPYPASGVPIVTHLHGGQTEFMSDGHPDAWFTPNFEQRGPEIARAVYVYDNEQEATTLWYHDHALGITRLNVYAGLAGFYLIRDEHEKKLIKKHKLPGAPYEIPVVIQDKMFTTEGALFYPTGCPGCPPNSILPEFFGDFIIVNGKAWPKLDVESRKYRFRLLNGSDSRFYRLTLRKEGSPNTPGNRIKFCQIGTDEGFLNSPVELDELLLAPAERADIIVDFSRLKNQNLIFYNDAPSPFPDGDLPADPESTALIFKMRVVKPLSSKSDCQLPARLRKKRIKKLCPDKPVRQLLLWETTDQFNRILPILGTAAAGMKLWTDPTTEKVELCAIEVWELYNTTGDAHPIHLHGVQFQIVDRQPFTALQNPTTGALTNINFTGPSVPPAKNERGLKDTVIAPPGAGSMNGSVSGVVTRIITNFKLPGEYVWHCHIISHEDNEMMRPLLVAPFPEDC